MGGNFPYVEQSRVDVLPVSLDYAKSYLYVSGSTHDTIITAMIKAARDVFEGLANTSLTEITYKTYRSSFYDRCFEIRKKPLMSISSIKYYDEDEVLQTVSSDDYYILPVVGYDYVKFKDDFTIPTTSSNSGWEIEIIFKSGYTSSADDIPEDIRDGLMAFVAYMFENRGDCVNISSNSYKYIPLLTKLVIDTYQVQEIGSL